MTRKFLLPAGLDPVERLRACRELCAKYHRDHLVTTGEIKPGKAQTYYAHIHTRRRAKREARGDHLGYFLK